ncbi:S-layer homology domain-containing protein [Paenibacillus sp. FA6]|uniref:S-layer homology domain-containing protein n=1 Tax=Paenibacillus sp. FA6 TaxID=3413029 RepID=UPI003F659170
MISIGKQDFPSLEPWNNNVMNDIKGSTDGTFQPNHKITHEEMAMMMDRVLEWTGGNKEGLTIGTPEGTIAPKQSVTRAEAAVVIQRMLEKLQFIN